MYRIALLIVYVLLFALAFRGDQYIANNPLQEDGYYALTVARNIALGNGLTIDGSTPTSGFQPLVTVVSSLCFVASGGDRILGLRLYLVFSVIVYAIAAWVFARIVTSLLGTETAMLWFSALVLWYSVSLYMFTMHVNGLETGMLLLGYGRLILHLIALPATRSRSWTLKLGLLLGLMILTRIDVLIPATMLMMWLFARDRIIPKADVLLGAACTGLIVAPWFAYVYSHFGTVMPSGGSAQTSLVYTAERIEQAFMNTAEAILPFAFLRFHVLSTFWGEVLRSLCFAALLPVLITTARNLRGRHAVRVNEILAWLAAGIAAMCMYYLVFSFATWHYTRYFSPVTYGISILGLVALLQSPLHKILKHMFFALYGFLFLAVVGVMLLGKGAGSEMIVDQLALVQRYVPSHQTVASGQTGTLGFMRDHVVNIDGKVNHTALLRRNDIPEYLRELNVRWFCDEPELINKFLGQDWHSRGWRIIGQKGNFVLLHR